MELTNDMIIMMPNKIDKINYAMMSPLEWVSDWFVIYSINIYIDMYLYISE